MTTATKNLTVLRATRILTKAGLFPSPHISIESGRGGVVEVQVTEELAGEHGPVVWTDYEATEALAEKCDAALRAAGFAMGWGSTGYGASYSTEGRRERTFADDLDFCNPASSAHY
jgi:hypothetical protein